MDTVLEIGLVAAVVPGLGSVVQMSAQPGVGFGNSHQSGHDRLAYGDPGALGVRPGVSVAASESAALGEVRRDCRAFTAKVGPIGLREFRIQFGQPCPHDLS